MTEIKRFEEGSYGSGEMGLSDNGPWVLFEDHAEIVAALQERIVFKENMTAEIVELQEQVRALAAENSALARYFSASSVAVNHWNSWADTEDKLACAPETPASDAVVREIRAQGCEMFIEFNRKLAKDYPTAMVAKALEVTEFNGEQYAARIRAGEQP